MARSIEWYYGEKGRIVGPMSFEDVAGRINRAQNEKHLVWTEGMARWADAMTVPAFTDLFRAIPPPLPALALSSLSSEDEIVWIKPVSRASPPMLPVLRGPPVWRDEPSAIGQTPKPRPFRNSEKSDGRRQPPKQQYAQESGRQSIALWRTAARLLHQGWATATRDELGPASMKRNSSKSRGWRLSELGRPLRGFPARIVATTGRSIRSQLSHAVRAETVS
jgi:hypothetical protein